MRRADRLVKLVHYLRQRRRAVTAQKIADDFGLCKRTVYRDIHDLMNAGVPIVGEAGVGYVIDKKYHLPPVMFDIDELEAISLGIAMVRNWTDEQFAEKAASALEKIQAVLPDRLLPEHQQITLHSMNSAARIPWQVSFSQIRECIRNRTFIDITYLDLKERHSCRRVRPLSLIFFGPVWLLVSWCEKRRDFRNFRLDRIKEMKVPGDTFSDEKDKSLAAYVDTCQAE